MFLKMSYLAKISKESHYINQCCGSGIFMPDPGSKRHLIPDNGGVSATKNLNIFNPTNCYQAPGNVILDTGSGSRTWIFFHLGSWIRGVKKARITDPDPQL
jgi:hypothetical protein